MPSYKAIKDHPRTGRDEIEFDGEPIEHVPYDALDPSRSASDNFTWGYGGAGPTNTARSILEHAVEEIDQEVDVDPGKLQRDFRDEFIAPRETSEEWELSLDEVREFIVNHA